MLYDSRDPPPQKKLKDLIAYAEERRLELLLNCNANSHDIGGARISTLGMINQERGRPSRFVMCAGLTILNRESELTFMDCRRQEVIDITVCTEGMTSLVGDWRVSDEPSGSDYRQIRYALKHTEDKKWGHNPQTHGLGELQDRPRGHPG